MPLLKARRWLGYRISVNDLIPDAERILDLFETSEIPLSDSFGSSSDPPERPRSVILFFGPGTEPQRLAELIDLLPASAVHYLQAGAENADRKTIYVGSYNFDGAPVAPATPELIEAVSRATSPGEVTQLVLDASLVVPLTIRS
jgi:hypothetical protein